MKVMPLGDAAAQIYVPINFTIGAPGQQPQPMRFLLNMVSGQDRERLASLKHIPDTCAGTVAAART